MMNLILQFLKNLFAPANPTNQPANNGAPDLKLPAAPVTTSAQGATPEHSHPDLAKWKPEWTDGVLPTITAYLPTLSKAQDIEKIYPGYHNLTEQNKALVWVELFKATCKFESDFDPKSSSVDVGTQKDHNTWSLGLLQMSVVDQANLGIKLGYTYFDLITAIPNLILATRVMANQVAKRGLVMIDKDSKGNPGTYWSTLKLRGPHDKSSQIMAYVQYLKFGDPVKQPVETPPVAQDAVHEENPAYLDAKKYDGKNENDPAFQAVIVPFWKKVGLSNYKTIVGSSFAWCALFIVMTQSHVGQNFIASAGAKDQRKTGIELDWKHNGIPKGAIVGLNHKGNCSSESDNHVTFADGDCTVADITKKDATFAGFGGNQSDQVKRSIYGVNEICSVRWPSEIKKPGPILKSYNCTGTPSKESTK